MKFILDQYGYAIKVDAIQEIVVTYDPEESADGMCVKAYTTLKVNDADEGDRTLAVFDEGDTVANTNQALAYIADLVNKLNAEAKS